MSTIGNILLATTFVSLVSLVGLLFLAFRQQTLKRVSADLVAFASGGLIGGAFFHLLPEAYELSGESTLSWVAAGILLFFLLEKILRWRHCHEAGCEVHPFTYLNLFGDGIHNLLDGMVIAAAFLVSFPLGAMTTLVVILHEVPQEIGDFGVLIYGGFSTMRAISLNLLSALTAIAGGLLGYFTALAIPQLQPVLLAVAAGSFIYIALADLVPELHKRRQPGESAKQFLLMVAGLVLLWIGKVAIPH